MGLVEAPRTHYGWERGFVSSVISVPAPLREIAPALSRLPLASLQLSYPEQKDVASIVDSGVLAAAPDLMIDQLSPIDDPIDAYGVRALVGATRGLTSFALCLRSFPGSVGAVSSAPALAGVRSLRFGDLDDAALLSMIGNFGAALRELTLTTDAALFETWRRLLGDRSLAALESLSLYCFREGDGDVLARAVAATELPRLRSLYLVDMTPESVETLVRAPCIAGLRLLKLRNVDLNGKCLRMLFERATALEELLLPGVEIDQGGVEAIAAHAPTSLRTLHPDTASSSLDLRPVVTTSRYVLRDLVLAADDVNDDLLAALAVFPFADRLTSLGVSGPATMRGARALVASRDLALGIPISWNMHRAGEAALTLVRERFPLTSSRA